MQIAKPLPAPNFPLAGKAPPSQLYAEYWAIVDHLLRTGTFGPLTNAANDAAAAAAGVPVGGLYRIANAVQIRLV